MLFRKLSYFSFFLFFILDSFSIYGQEADNEKFIISAPDTVTSGESFTITFILTTNKKVGMMNWKFPNSNSKDGFHLTNRPKGTKTIGQHYTTYRFSGEYSTLMTGKLELPIMTIPVGDTVYNSERRDIFVKESEYSKEIGLAQKWLVEHGQHPDSVNLKIGSDDTDFRIYEDTRNHCFCIVAKKELWHLLENPVLAYSTECAIHCTPARTQSRQHNSIMQTFRKQIAQLKENEGKIITSPLLYTPKHTKVMPLLGGNKWSQRMPYNLYTPTVDGKKTPVGCVPTAASIVINYHQWPEQGKSNTHYRWNNKVYNFDFSTFRPQWKAYKDSYVPSDSTEDSAQNLARLLVFMSYAVDAKFSDSGSCAQMSKVKPILVNNLGYSGRISNYDENNSSDAERASFIYRDLDEGRPCIVSNNGHAFVCDGYHEGFLHYNLGWGGQYNGYYRLTLGSLQRTYSDESLIQVKNVICGIEPLRKEEAYEVTLEKAGTLDEMLSDEEKGTITKLIVKGPINSADIRLLRKMAGANDEITFEGWRGGSLIKLDLSEAEILKDNHPYATILATGKWTISSGNGKMETHDFKNMTKKEWKRIKDNLNRWGDITGKFYTRSDDNRYWENFITINQNVIGSSMFANCSSLKSIVLPQKTKVILDYAFRKCSSLKSIVIPPSTISMGRDPFRDCESLEEVKIPKNISVNSGKICVGCSPAVEAIIY